MVFLFVIDNLKSDCGANVNIALNLSKALRNMGNQVIAVTRQNIDNEICEYNKKSFDKVFVVPDKCYDILFGLYKEKKWNTRTRLYKLKEYFLRPYLLPIWIDWKVLEDGSLKRAYISQIRKADIDYKLDVVLAFSKPQWTETIVAKVSSKALKGVFKLDPYIYNEMYKGERIKKRQKKEQKIIDRVDLVFVTDLILNDLIEKNWNSRSTKLRKYQFPGILSNETFVNNEEGERSKESIHIYFVGRLFEDIRNPEFVLNLFLNLHREYILHIVGYGADSIIEKYRSKLGRRLVLHGALSSTAAHKLMQNADVLLNIGNTIRNQLPSKIFDYINTGRPIINCCKLKDCPSIKYLSKYPLGYSFFEQDGITENLKKEIIDFVETNVNKQVCKETILELYQECTDTFVAESIVKEFSLLKT